MDVDNKQCWDRIVYELYISDKVSEDRGEVNNSFDLNINITLYNISEWEGRHINRKYE